MSGPNRLAGAYGTARVLPPTRGLLGATASSLEQFWADRPDALKRHIESPGNSDRHDTTERSDRAEENQA